MAKKIIVRVVLWFIGIVLALLLLAVGLVYVFKDRIIKASVTEINKYLNTKVDINPKIELSLYDKFPQVAIGFKDVKIYESIPGSDSLLGSVETLYLTFDFWNILNGNYIINKLYVENGKFTIRVNKEGEGNYSILKSDSTKSAKGSGGLDLTDIYLKNILVIYQNNANEQYYEVLSHELKAGFSLSNDKYFIKLQGPQLINSIQVRNGDYFKGKEIFISSDLIFDNIEKKFTILPTVIKLQNSDFKVAGFYVYKDIDSIDLKIDNDKGDIQTLLSLIPKEYSAYLTSYKSEGEIYFHATVKGAITETQNAAIKVDLGCKKASFFHPDLKKKIQDANFYGVFTNGEKRNAASSYVAIENVRFDLDGKMIQGNFMYKNFDDPFILFDITGTAEAASILGFYKIPSLQSAKGVIDFDIDFKGRLADLKTREGHSRIEAGGELSIQDFSCNFEAVDLQLEKTNGNFLFNKNDIAITEFSTKIGKSDFRINGLLKNLFGALLLENARMLVDVQLQSDRVDVDELLAYRKKEDVEESNAQGVKKGVFPFLEKYLIKIDVEVKNISYKKVRTSNFKGFLSLDQPYMKAENIAFTIAGGTVSLASQLNFISEEKIETTLRSTLSTINIDSLLFMFDNFGQDFMTYKNLRGQFSGALETAFSWNSKGEINTKSLVASIDGSILKGELNEFEPMQNLAKFIDAKELAHIKFSEIRNKIFIENRMISIPEMQILSNVSDISVSGTHTFDNEMDYKLAVPLKNILKPRIDKDEAFGAIEEDPKKGSTVFLTIKGTAANYKIWYDTKRTKTKIAEDLKKEKDEFKNLFKKKEEDAQQTVKPNQEEFFDF